MVKKRVGGAQRFKGSKGHEPSEPDRPGPAPPAHVQRKLARKVAFLDKVATSKAKALAAVGSLKKRTSKKPRSLPSLDTLVESLTDLVESSKAKADSDKEQQLRVKSVKGRLHTGRREASRLQQVLQHPQYQKNPLAAISSHLNNTLPPPQQTAPQPQKGTKRRK